ncbi:hypothetical protein C8Q73DRAFT_384387 [Cubamyces lactineus]|nr:hypothetical protein C8Q73DRAFT_384387 [Cubamyces lactineus]
MTGERAVMRVSEASLETDGPLERTARRTNDSSDGHGLSFSTLETRVQLKSGAQVTKPHEASPTRRIDAIARFPSTFENGSQSSTALQAVLPDAPSRDHDGKCVQPSPTLFPSGLCHSVCTVSDTDLAQRCVCGRAAKPAREGATSEPFRRCEAYVLTRPRGKDLHSARSPRPRSSPQNSTRLDRSRSGSRCASPGMGTWMLVAASDIDGYAQISSSAAGLQGIALWTQQYSGRRSDSGHGQRSCEKGTRIPTTCIPKPYYDYCSPAPTRLCDVNGRE